MGEELREFCAADPGLDSSVAIDVREDSQASPALSLADEVQEGLI